jgi:hypothetical protein
MREFWLRWLALVLIASLGIGCGGNAPKGVNSNLDKPKQAKPGD